jgi:hypothetical protein
VVNHDQDELEGRETENTGVGNFEDHNPDDDAAVSRLELVTVDVHFIGQFSVFASLPS